MAAGLNNLARLLQAQGKLDEATPLFKESLAIRKKVFGDEHPDVGESLNNIALVLQAQSKYDEATPLYKESLAIKKKVLGEEHPSVATGLNNLAELLKSQARTFLTIRRCIFFVFWSAFSRC